MFVPGEICSVARVGCICVYVSVGLSGRLSAHYLQEFCPTLTKGSKWHINQIWESDVFTLDLAYSTSIPSLEQKHSSCWKIFKSRHYDIALMSMYMTDTFCSFTRNFIFKGCFLLSEYGRVLLSDSETEGYAQVGLYNMYLEVLCCLFRLTSIRVLPMG